MVFCTVSFLLGVNKLMTINDKISTCELVSFSHFRINVIKMQVHDNADFSITVELTLAHFTTLKGWLNKFCILEIIC